MHDIVCLTSVCRSLPSAILPRSSKKRSSFRAWPFSDWRAEYNGILVPERDECNSVGSIPPCDRPVTPCNNPVPPCNRPVTPCNRPVTPHIRPATPCNRPVPPHINPVEPCDRPAEPCDRPVEPCDRPVEPLERPVRPTGGVVSKTWLSGFARRCAPPDRRIGQ